MYLNGLGVKKNSTLAKMYFEKAIELRYFLGYNGLGYIYFYGEGVQKNLTKAMQYFQKAYDSGLSNEATMLA